MTENRIRKLRTDILCMNQTEFAKMLGISQGALSDIENGKRGLPTEAVEKLAAYSLGDTRVDITWVLTGYKMCSLTDREYKLLTVFRKLDEHEKKIVENAANTVRKR